MVKEIVIDESYQTTKVFDAMKVGDIYNIPYDHVTLVLSLKLLEEIVKHA